MAAHKTTSSVLDQIVQQRYQEQLLKQSCGLQDLELFDFIKAASPHYEAPEHLSPIVPHLMALCERPGMLCFSAPPRHSKSVTINHYVAWRMLREPGLKVAYGCYSLDLSAGWFSGEIKDIFTSNGIPLDRTQNSKQEWRLRNGSTFKAVAPGAGFVGRGADLIIIDDPYKSRQSVESAKVREEVLSWFRSVAITRRSPNASVIILHTRWKTDDLIGTVVKEYGFPYVNIPAINDVGEALWPKYWPAERLIKEVKHILGDYEWASQYLGNPVERGGGLFGDTTTYDRKELGETRFVRKSIGIDCAYSTNTKSDYSTAVLLGYDKLDRAWILDTIHGRFTSSEFADKLNAMRKLHELPPVYWYISGIEKGLVDFFAQKGIRVQTKPAVVDKFIRAQPVAAAFNAGRVLMPDDPELAWARSLTNELLEFPNGKHDDQVDALSAAWIPFSKGNNVTRGMSQRRVLPF